MTNSKDLLRRVVVALPKASNNMHKYDRERRTSCPPIYICNVTVNFSCRTTSSRRGGNGSRVVPRLSSPKVQAKTQPAKSDKVVFSGTAKKQLDSLGLSEKHRQDVVRWHERTTRREMNLLGADRAKIR
jgi:hypothetical protein